MTVPAFGNCSSYSNSGGATTINGSNNPVLEFVTQTGDVTLVGLTLNAAHVILSSRTLSYCLNNRPNFNVRRLRVDQGGIALDSRRRLAVSHGYLDRGLFVVAQVVIGERAPTDAQRALLAAARASLKP